MFDIDKSGCLSHYSGDSPYVVIPEGVRRIERRSFSGRSDIKEVMIPDTVRWIGDYAFMDCESLQQVRLPGAAEYIGEKCFRNSGLKELMVPGGTEMIRYGAFSGCSNLETVYFEEGIKMLTDTCLEFCPKLHKVYIPASVIQIGEYTFCADDNVLIIAPQSSFAQMFAAQHNIPFQLQERNIYTERTV